jgi:uncharacterized protein
MKHIALILALLIIVPTLARADLDDGFRAYQRGDYATALREWRPLADQGEAAAQYNLGLMYANGKGVGEDDAEAAKWYRRAADQGHAAAQNNLGVMYANGKGVRQDYAEAAKWYRRAADQGHAAAQYNLGVMYDKGQGVRQDYAEAVKWYRLAADQGHADAQYNLGIRYFKGEGVAENYVQAYRWWSLVAAAGDQVARKNLQIIKGLMTPGQIAEAQRLAAGGKVGAPAAGWSAVNNSDVRLIQKALSELGFAVGPIDGIAGNATKSALETFQRVKGLPVVGPDQKTLQALGVR